jgi:hypothetical protein
MVLCQDIAARRILTMTALWENMAVGDFRSLREQGRYHPLKAEIEELFEPSTQKSLVRGE